MFDIVHRLSDPLTTASFTLGICPANAGETAALLAASIAAAAAQAGRHKILLIETSRRNSALAGIFGINPSAPGLFEMLLPPPHNRFDTIYPTAVRNLFVLPAGGPGHRRDFMPSSQEMEWTHRILSPHFPGMVLELPPMGELRTREFCRPIPNAVVLVAAPGGAEAWTVRRVVRDLHKDNAKLIGSAVSDI